MSLRRGSLLSFCVLGISTMSLLALVGCLQAFGPRHGTPRTEDISQIVYNEPWLKDFVYVRNVKVARLEGNLLELTVQFHSTEAHKSREVCVQTEFYAPALAEGGTVVDKSEWQHFVLEPRKRVQYKVNSLVPADDFRTYVYYSKDIGKR